MGYGAECYDQNGLGDRALGLEQARGIALRLEQTLEVTARKSAWKSN